MRNTTPLFRLAWTLFLLLMWMTQCAFAQTFSQTYDYPNVTGLRATEMPTGYRLLGTNDTQGTANPTSYVEILTDLDGNSVQVQSTDISNPNNGKVFPARDGNFFVLGKLADDELQLKKVNPTGTTIWSKSYVFANVDGVFLGSLAENDQGTIFVSGSRDLIGGTLPDSDLFILKIQPNGMVIWGYPFPTYNSSGTGLGLGGFKVKASKDGGCMVNYNIASPDARAFIKVDAAGNSLYNKGLACCINSILSFDDDAFGNVFYTERQTGISGPVNTVSLVKKLAPNGDLISTVFLNSSLFAPPTNPPSVFLTFVNAWKVHLLDDGSLIVAGVASSTFSSPAFFMMKLNGNGVVEWVNNTYDFNAVPHRILATSDGGFLVNGFKDSKPWLMKTDAFGNFQPTSGEIDLELSIFPSKTTFTSYEEISFRVQVQNNSDQVATGAKIQFFEPDGTVFTGGNEYYASQGTFEPYVGFEWSVGPLVPGAVAYIEFNLYTLQKANPIVAYTQVVQANQQDEDSSPGNGMPPTVNEDDEAVVTIFPEGFNQVADLELTLLNDEPETFFDGGPMRVVVFNRGPAEATGVSVRLDASTFSSVILGINPSQGTTDLTLTSIFTGGNWDVGTIAAGATANLEINVQFVDQYNTAFIFAQVETSDQVDPDSNPGNDVAGPFTPDEDDEDQLIKLGGGGPPADLELFKTTNVQTAGTGDQVTFTISLENNGNYPSPNVSVKDVLPSGLLYQSSDATIGSYDPATGIWNIGFVAERTYPGAPSELVTEAELTIVTTVTNISQAITNFAQIETGYDIDATPGNDTDNTPDEDDEAAVTVLPDCTGSYFLNTQADVDAFACVEVGGNLYIGKATASNIVDLSPLASLVSVGGYFVIENNPGLTDLSGLDNLTEVGSWFFIRYNDGLTSLEGLGALQSVDGAMTITDNDQLDNLDALTSLTTIGLDFSVSENDLLQDVSGLGTLQNVGGTLLIVDNFSLPAIDGISSLTATGAGLWMSRNNSMTHIGGFSSLSSIGGDLSIRQNPALESFDPFPMLTHLGANLRVEDNNSLLNLDGLSTITSVANNIWIYGNPVLSDCCGLYPLLSVNGVGGSVNIYNNPSFCSSASEILANCAPVCAGDLTLSTQAEVNAFGPCTIWDGDILIEGNDITDLGPLAGLTEITGQIIISNCPQIQTLNGLQDLTTVGSHFALLSNTQLGQVGALMHLSTVGKDFVLIGNDQLTNVDGFSGLTTIEGQMILSSNDMLQNLNGLQSVVHLGGSLEINDNDQLSGINILSGLNAINGSFYLIGNEKLTHVNGLAYIESVTNYLVLSTNPSLSNIQGLASLQSVGGPLVIYDNDQLVDLNPLSNLLSVGEDLYVYENAILSNCCGLYPLLSGSGVAGEITIEDNPSFCSSESEILANCAPVCSGDITLSSQAEVDAFGPCTVWDGDIYIEGADIVDLNSFVGLTEITGQIIINDCPQLQNLNGLQDLTIVGDDFALLHNPQVKQVDPLTNLSTVGDDFVLIGNDQLKNVDGFSGLTSIQGQMIVSSNDALQQLNGLQSVVHLGGSLEINGNDQLSGINILSGLNEINGSVYVLGNEKLTNIVGLNYIQSVSDYLVLSANPSLSNIQGLASLQSVGGYLVIHDNDQLADLNALSNVLSVGGDLYVYENAILSNCCGIYPLLSNNGVGGSINIYDNPSFCSSASEILANCAGSVDYCESYGEFPWHEWIAGFEFVDIHNPSGKSKYSDFTAQSTDINIGQSYDFSLTIAYSYFTYDEYLRIWIDFNQDGDFDDPSELITSRWIPAPPDGTPTKIESGPLFIPNNIPAGETRMRVSLKRGDYPEPCGTFPFGEVEDYTIRINDTGPLPDLILPNNEVIQNGYRLCKTNPGEKFGFFGGVIVNGGTADAGPFSLIASFSKDDQINTDDIFWQKFDFTGVGVNNADYYTVDNPVPASLPPGKYFIILQLDPLNQVMESNELNNVEVFPVQIGGADYTVSMVNGLPATVAAGQSINFTAELTNISPFPLDELSGDVPLEIFLSEDDVFDASQDLSIGTAAVDLSAFSNPPLYLNGTALANLSASIPNTIGNGDYFLFVRVGIICEQTSLNNTSEAYSIQIGDFSGTYCDSYGDFPWHEWISRVSIDQQINNSSGKSQYSDFTGLTPANITIGSTVNLLIDVTYSYYTFQEFLNIWIDFDQNGSFEDDEKWSGGVAPPAPGKNATVTRGGIFNIPADALPGATRMRVSMQRGSYPPPCGVIPFGEVEDYTVVLVDNAGPGSIQSRELLMLDAERKGYTVDLDWVTNTDFKNESFIIERSADGEDFEAIAEVMSTSESDQPLHYRGVDEQPQDGYNYYRIKEVYEDGSFHYSNQVIVEFEPVASTFELFPNPAKHEVYVNLQDFAGKSATIRLYDSFGRTIFDQQLEAVPDHPFRIDLSNYNNGLYHLSVKVENRRLRTKQLVISRLY